MPAIAIAWNGCVVPGTGLLGLRCVIHKTYFLLIVDIVATRELLGPFGGVRQEVQ